MTDYIHIFWNGDLTGTLVEVLVSQMLDNFLANERLVSLVEEVKVLHRGENMSRRSPILLKLRVGEIPIKNKVAYYQGGQHGTKLHRKTSTSRVIESSHTFIPLSDVASCSARISQIRS